MAFEYDTDKSAINKDKHGIDFEEAQILWRDPQGIYIDVTSGSEQRLVLISRLEDKFWSAVITFRDDNIRLISVRRSRKKEIEIYEENQKNNSP